MSTPEKFYSAAPIAAVTAEVLWAEGDSPFSGRSWMASAMPVTWLRECEAQAVFLHGGVEVAQFSRYCDGAEFLSCVELAIGEASSRARRFSINATSTARIEVKLCIIDRPALYAIGPTTTDGCHSSSPKAVGGRRLWMKADRFSVLAPEGSDGSDAPRYLPLAVKKRLEQSVWSAGSTDPADLQAMLAGLRATWLPNPSSIDSEAPETIARSAE